jgi:hypothetical protein
MQGMKRIEEADRRNGLSFWSQNYMDAIDLVNKEKYAKVSKYPIGKKIQTSQNSNREIQKRSITKRKVQFFLFFHFLSQKNNERRVASFVTFQGTACPSAYLALALSSLMHIKVCVVLTDVSDISAGILSYQLIRAY